MIFHNCMSSKGFWQIGPKIKRRLQCPNKPFLPFQQASKCDFSSWNHRPLLNLLTPFKNLRAVAIIPNRERHMFQGYMIPGVVVIIDKYARIWPSISAGLVMMIQKKGGFHSMVALQGSTNRSWDEGLPHSFRLVSYFFAHRVSIPRVVTFLVTIRT